MNKLLGNKGYTLIELMITIAIIVLSAASLAVGIVIVWLMILGIKALTIYINGLALLV